MHFLNNRSSHLSLALRTDGAFRSGLRVRGDESTNGHHHRRRQQYEDLRTVFARLARTRRRKEEGRQRFAKKGSGARRLWKPDWSIGACDRWSSREWISGVSIVVDERCSSHTTPPTMVHRGEGERGKKEAGGRLCAEFAPWPSAEIGALSAKFDSVRGFGPLAAARPS